MNIYELEKQATPGLHDRGSGFAEATLTRHCRNNFMRTLEALKKCERELQRLDGYDRNLSGHDNKVRVSTTKLIAELEEV